MPGGAFGEIVFTSLTEEARPVVRYRTGDLTRLLHGAARSMRRMEKVSGRTDDMMIVRGVNVFSTQIEDLILGVFGLSPHDRLVLSREGRLDELAHARKAHIGIAAKVSVLKPGEIERSSGKATRVIDKRPGA